MSDGNNELKLKLLGPAAESAGSTLQNIWELVFGKFNLYAQKKKFNREKAFEDFKKSFEKRVIEIPPQELQEPKLSVLGPTLEASKFYFEEKPLREMFAALAAASLDKRKERDLHPSFPEIIKQMSPLDAQNLLSFASRQLPVVEYYKKKKGKDSRVTVLSNVFLANSSESDLELQSSSLSSLERLGLIHIEYERVLLADKYYAPFFTTDYFLQLAAKLGSTGYIAGVLPGRAVVTPFGKSFKAVCLG